MGPLAKEGRVDMAATYLLASEEPEAKDCLRGVVPTLLAIPYLAEKQFWQRLDFWLGRSPTERCLAHLGHFESIHALALLDPADSEVEGMLDVLLDLAERKPGKAEPLFGGCMLAAIWALAHAQADTALRVLPRLRPSRWIEQQEFDALANRLTSSKERKVDRPSWVPSMHPAVGRDLLGGALLSSVLRKSPSDIFSPEWIEEAPGDWVILGDLDHLRSLNNRLGFLGGDLAIYGTIQTLQEQVGDRVIRFAGQRFLLLVDGADGLEVAELLRETIAAASYAPMGHLQEPVEVTMSFGVARGGNLALSLRAAEAALGEAKRAGGGCVVAA